VYIYPSNVHETSENAKHVSHGVLQHPNKFKVNILRGKKVMENFACNQ